MNQIADYFVNKGYTITFDKIDKNIVRIQADNPKEPHFYHIIYTTIDVDSTWIKSTLVINKYDNNVTKIQENIFRYMIERDVNFEKYIYEDFTEFISNNRNIY